MTEGSFVYTLFYTFEGIRKNLFYVLKILFF